MGVMCEKRFVGYLAKAIVVALAGLGTAALPGGCSSTSKTNIITKCSPESTERCFGPNDCVGTRSCNDAGVDFGPCICDDAGATGDAATDSSSADSSSGGTDSGAPDSSSAGTGGADASQGSGGAGGSGGTGGVGGAGGNPCAGADDGTPCDSAKICVKEVCRTSECGDGYPDTPGEQCDDGANGNDNDGCTDDCKLTCESDADCDDGVDCTIDTCSAAICSHSLDNTKCPASNCYPGVCSLGGCGQGPTQLSTCRVVSGKQIFVKPGASTDTGNMICAAAGLTCVSAPVLSPASAACLAFHPGAAVSSSANGWKQGIYCDNNDGLACSGKVGCHDCPACNPGLDCTLGASTQLEEMYVECAP